MNIPLHRLHNCTFKSRANSALLCAVAALTMALAGCSSDQPPVALPTCVVTEYMRFGVGCYWVYDATRVDVDGSTHTAVDSLVLDAIESYAARSAYRYVLYTDGVAVDTLRLSTGHSIMFSTIDMLLNNPLRQGLRPDTSGWTGFLWCYAGNNSTFSLPKASDTTTTPEGTRITDYLCTANIKRADTTMLMMDTTHNVHTITTRCEIESFDNTHTQVAGVPEKLVVSHTFGLRLNVGFQFLASEIEHTLGTERMTWSHSAKLIRWGRK